MKNMDEKFILSLPKEVLPGEQETKLAGADLQIRAFFLSFIPLETQGYSFLYTSSKDP